jgi:integrating conjugative element protein (TIGR03746 family)
MSLAAKIDEQKDKTIKSQKGFIIMLFSIVFLVCINNYQLRQTMRLYLPPDLSVGQIIEAGAVDKSYAYFFAYNILGGIARWKKNGEVEYSNNISMYRNYISSHFEQQLRKDFVKRSSDERGRLNELKNRTREMTLIRPDKPSKMVKKVGSGNFVIYLDVQDEERLAGVIVKSGIYRYSLNIAVDTGNLLDNDTGLRVLGFADEPVLIQ